MKIYTNEIIKKKKDKRNKILKILRRIFMPIILLIVLLAGYIAYQKLILKRQNVELFGYKAYIVLTGSMQPAINPGDIVIVKRVSQDKIQEKDIITFTIENSESTVTHRIIKIEKDNDGIKYTTKGDNNNSEDTDKVEFSQIEGKVIKKVDKIGFIIIGLLTGTGLIVVIILVILSYIYSTRKEDRKLAREDARKKFNVCKYKKD